MRRFEETVSFASEAKRGTLCAGNSPFREASDETQLENNPNNFEVAIGWRKPEPGRLDAGRALEPAL